jgi:DNA-binding CsgD family transcriptional regulator
VSAVTITRAGQRAAERIEELAAEAVDVTSLRQSVLEVLHDVVAFSAHVWLLTDPVTAVGAAPHALVPCLPELPALIKAQYLTDVSRWTSPTAATAPTSRLYDVTSGDLALSRSWREVKCRYGVRDTMMTVFRDLFGIWGFLELWSTDEPFRLDDAELMDRVAAPLTVAIRSCVAGTFQPAERRRQELGPVVLTLDDDLAITGRTAASAVWLDLLLPPSGGTAVPASVLNVAAQLLAREADVDDHPALSRVHLRGGLWLTARAARISDGCAPGKIVVTLEEASAQDRLEIFARACGLTPRERDLVDGLATGGNTRSIAKAMAVTENTVQDHLKAVFTKTGSHDRGTVLARALGTRSSSSTT